MVFLHAERDQIANCIAFGFEIHGFDQAVNKGLVTLLGIKNGSLFVFDGHNYHFSVLVLSVDILKSE